MNKKYKLTDESIKFKGHTLYRIKAIKDFGYIKKGNLGGYIESESNLSHDGNCWVYDDAKVFGNAKVYDHARVSINSEVYENAKVYNYADVSVRAKVYGNAQVYGNALVLLANVCGYAQVYDCTKVIDNAKVFGHAKICDYAQVYKNTEISGDVEINANTVIGGKVIISKMNDYIVFKNHWSSGRYFTYIKSNKMWSVGCFYGTGEELIEKAYKDSELSGKMYEKYVKFVNKLEKLENLEN